MKLMIIAFILAFAFQIGKAKLPPKCTRYATEFDGTVIGTELKASWKSCRITCEFNDNCNYWTYISKTDSDVALQRMCYLMSDKSAENSAPKSRKSGSRTC